MALDIRPRVAIVGGGFSGTLVLLNLAYQSDGGFDVDWFESDEHFGLGTAYGTDDNVHLLNVRAELMGALAGTPDDFWVWLQTGPGHREKARLCPGQEIHKDSYVPRALYGSYLLTVVKTALEHAQAKNINVRTHRARVIDAELFDRKSDQLLLTVEEEDKREEFLVHALVLATGNLPPRDSVFQSHLLRGKTDYVANIWDHGPRHIYPERVKELSADSEIVIIGTGLTMVDAVLTLRSRGYKGTVTAISRHGLLPATHLHGKKYPAWGWVANPDSAPRTVGGLMKGLRQEIAKAEKEGYDWRNVVDSLRPVTQTLWKQLSIPEKRRFLHNVSTFWSVHRHRMAPEIGAILKSMKQSGALKIIAGKIYYVGSDDDGLTVAYRKRGANRIETVRTRVVLNCTGPEYDIAASEHKLLKNLRDRELITIGPLRIGIETTPQYTARGAAAGMIFPIGTLLIGELLECTAVPELREQAKLTAQHVLHRVALVEPQRGLWANGYKKVLLFTRKLRRA